MRATVGGDIPTVAVRLMDYEQAFGLEGGCQGLRGHTWERSRPGGDCAWEEKWHTYAGVWGHTDRWRGVERGM